MQICLGKKTSLHVWTKTVTMHITRSDTDMWRLQHLSFYLDFFSLPLILCLNRLLLWTGKRRHYYSAWCQSVVCQIHPFISRRIHYLQKIGLDSSFLHLSSPSFPSSFSPPSFQSTPLLWLWVYPSPPGPSSGRTHHKDGPRYSHRWWSWNSICPLQMCLDCNTNTLSKWIPISIVFWLPINNTINCLNIVLKYQ